jgi:uncharacterized protein (DUF1778 family)
MNERKTTAINLRMAQDVKELLRLAAAKEHRTLSNMLEYLILQHCKHEGLSLGTGGQPSRKEQGAK